MPAHSSSATVRYLRDLYLIHATGSGTEETSFYGPLENLLNAVGTTITPNVRAVFQLRDLGAGRPDFGLFAIPATKKAGVAMPVRRPKQLPERGAGEVKDPTQLLEPLLKGKQVSKYWKRYGQVLITNLRSFVFLATDSAGKPLELDRFELATSADSFWQLCATADSLPTATQDAFHAFLSRCLRHGAPLDQPRDVAWFLASFAREAQDRLSEVNLSNALGSRLEALEETLQVRFEGPKGNRFLRATIIQTLFYGIFSAWVLWHRENPARTDRFDWRTTSDYLRLPVLQVLFEMVGAASQVQRLDLRDLLESAGLTLNRVRRDRFFARFEHSMAIQYFYEPFLDAYDPQLRKEMGVWYTPPELVRYMVHQIDQVLQRDLGIEDGLANPDVLILDPCCGTGTYLLEVVRLIAARLREKHGQLAGVKLRQAVVNQLRGFEIMTAPFVIAHMQLGLALQAHGAELEPGQQLDILLTNALTGGQASEHDRQIALLPDELAGQVKAARRVKRQERITVVLGNPPYDGFAGMAVKEERELVTPYRQTSRTVQPQGQGLNDLYVRFFRMAERQIAERSGRGIVCFVSNSSWLDGLSHPGMREHLLDSFDRIYIDNLHGDKYRTGKLTPDGRPDPSVFSSPLNREGIQVGTAVAMLVKNLGVDAQSSQASVSYRSFWGAAKLRMLEQCAGYDSGQQLLLAEKIETESYQSFKPQAALGLPFLPRQAGESYLKTPSLPEIFPVFYAGVKTSRDEVLVDIDRSVLAARMQQFFNNAIPDHKLRQAYPKLMKGSDSSDTKSIRGTLLKHGFNSGTILKYSYRPFDQRWLYWHPLTKLLDRNRPEFVESLIPGNLFLEARQKSPNSFDRGLVTTTLGDNLGNGLSSYFPLYRTKTVADSQDRLHNLSSMGWQYITSINEEQPERVFYHAIAIIHTPEYRQVNADALQQDWPRIPLPINSELLKKSSELGRVITALFDMEQPVSSEVTEGHLDTLKPIAQITHRDLEGLLKPSQGHFEVRANWGKLTPTGQVMPGPGLYNRRLAEGLPPRGLGHDVVDAYLNEEVYWGGIPGTVWDYTVGGYQVLKKWLSYRSFSVMRRSLTIKEIEEFTDIARRIASLLMLSAELDQNYKAMLTETPVLDLVPQE